MAGQVLGVADVSAYLKQLIESDDFLSDLWVEGEISDYFVSRQGHIYFTLNDERATLRCVMFKGSAVRQRSNAQSGDQVVVHGRFSIYEQQGRYQLYADLIQPAGLGLQALQFELLRQKLEGEGLFDDSRKRSLPPAPKVIGVVTSAEGAVWHDIQQVLRRRYPFTHLILSPSAVQGERAPASIVAALQRLIDDGRSEVIIVGRGGGSAEDLSAFNDERVVRAAFASPTPIVSAVGHETDWTLLDLVADLRAPTPSAAAELVAPSVANLAEELIELDRSMRDIMLETTLSLRLLVDTQQRHIRRFTPVEQIRRAESSIDQIQRRIIISAIGEQRTLRQRTETASRSVAIAGARSLANLGASLEVRSAGLAALEPGAVLHRGYALIQDVASGSVIRSIDELSAGSEIRTSLIDGVFTGKVDQLFKRKLAEDIG
jgi:exodeoxyribonuclease VII large subunit